MSGQSQVTWKLVDGSHEYEVEITSAYPNASCDVKILRVLKVPEKSPYKAKKIGDVLRVWNHQLYSM